MMGADAMIDILRTYKYVVRDRDRHGRWRYYLRRPGHPKIRLRAKPGSSEFDQEYQAAILTSAAARPDEGDPHTLRWLVKRYVKSAEFQRLSESTQRVRELILEHVIEEASSPGSAVLFGECPLTRMSPKLVRVLRDRKAKFPHAANNRVKIVRRMFRWGVENELLESNPAVDVAALHAPSTGHHTWIEEEIALFEARWPIGSKERLAFALLRYLGIRRSDVVRLGRQHLRDGVLRFTTKKGARRNAVSLELPMPVQLCAIIEQSTTGDLAFLVTDHGLAFTAAGFGGWFRERCDDAELPHCSAHGLRKAAATALADAGATPHQLMAWFGWKSIKEAERYTRAANQKKLAASVVPLIEGKGGT